jgi:hypothetical protein
MYEYVNFRSNPHAPEVDITGPGLIRVVSPTVIEVTMVCERRTPAGLILIEEAVRLRWLRERLPGARIAMAVGWDYVLRNAVLH